MDPTLESGPVPHRQQDNLRQLRAQRRRALRPRSSTRPTAAADRTLFAFHSPVHGEVVIFHYPHNLERDFVKRVIGLPGDTIEIRRGDVYRNGVLVEEDYVTHDSARSYDPVTVTRGHYYVLGDNRRASNDSRDWGLVPAELPRRPRHVRLLAPPKPRTHRLESSPWQSCSPSFPKSLFATARNRAGTHPLRSLSARNRFCKSESHPSSAGIAPRKLLSPSQRPRSLPSRPSSGGE